MRFSLFLLFILLIFSTHQVSAARDLFISVDKSTIFSDEEMIVTATYSGFLSGEKIYIKGAFYETGSTNYFALTKNGLDWVKNSTSAVDQRSVIIGEWDNFLSVRSDYSDSGFKGNSVYNFKVGYYYLTTGGNLSSVNWSNSVNISLQAPTVTQEQSKEIVAKTVSINQATPTPTKAIIKYQKISESIIYPTDFDKIEDEVNIASDFATVKSEHSEKTKPPKMEILGEKTRNFNLFFLMIGFGFFVPSIIYLIYKNIDLIKIWIQK